MLFGSSPARPGSVRNRFSVDLSLSFVGLPLCWRLASSRVCSLLDSWLRNWIRPADISWIWWVSGCVAVLGLTVWVGSCAGVGCLAIARCVIRCLDVKFELFLSFFGEVLRFRWRSAGEPGPDSCLALLDLWNLFAPFLVRFFPLLRLFRPESKLPVKAGAS